MKKILRTAAAMMLVLSLGLCSCGISMQKGDKQKKEDRIRICLADAPVTGLAGIYLAQEKGYYEEAGLELDIVKENDEGALAMCAEGETDFLVTDPVEMADYMDRNYPTGLLAAAALYPHNQTGILSRKGDGITRLKKLTGQTYSSKNLPTELGILESLVKEDGGSFRDVVKIPLDDNDLSAALAAHDTDAVWASAGWDLVGAGIENFEYDYISMSEAEPALDYPELILAADHGYLKENTGLARKFMAATRKGYEDAISSPDEAAKCLIRETKASKDEQELITASQKWASAHYVEKGRTWGLIEKNRWEDFFSWLYEKNVTEHDLSRGTFTNACFK